LIETWIIGESEVNNMSEIEILELKSKIENLNNAQFGSFGEFVFAYHAVEKLGKTLTTLHRDGFDFIYEDIKIDVGASRRFNSKNRTKTIPKKDVFVFFWESHCDIIFPNYFDAQLEWDLIDTLFENWSKNHKVKTKQSEVRSYSLEYREIRTRIEEYFQNSGFEAKVIYRTVSAKFGYAESPDNLYPTKINVNRVNVYVDFRSLRREEDNINFIIAFPDTELDCLPLQSNVTLKSGKSFLKKVDLVVVRDTNHKCLFLDLLELENQFFLRYKR
jgi:hypothetical protein